MTWPISAIHYDSASQALLLRERRDVWAFPFLLIGRQISTFMWLKKFHCDLINTYDGRMSFQSQGLGFEQSSGFIFRDSPFFSGTGETRLDP